jgi:integrase
MPRLKLTEKALTGLAPADGEAQTFYSDTEVRGFGVRVGAHTRTFCLRVGQGKERHTITIGRHGEMRSDGERWTVALARKRALELLGQIASGKPLPAAPKPREVHRGPTLADGLALHVANMRKRRSSAHSIRSIEQEVALHLSAWLKRPLSALTAAELDATCKRIMAAAKPRPGAVNPPGAAVSNRLLRHVSAIWESASKLHDLPPNPAQRVTQHVLLPRDERVTDFADWYATVETLSPVRRDLQLFAMFTGLRSESVRTLRWDDVDWDRRVLYVRKAKGNKPYVIPLASTHLEILERRRRENAVEFDPHGGDHGWVFPSLSRAYPQRVKHVAETKEIRDGEKILPGLHPLRRTYNSVAREIGIRLEDREALMNHSPRGVNEKHYVATAEWTHLAECQAKIEAALWQRIHGQSDGKRGTLRVLEGGKE